MKKVLSYLISILGFLGLSYYYSKFYTYRGLPYDKKYIPMYIVVFIIMTANIIICMVNTHKISKQSEELEEIKEQNINILRQNKELKNLIMKLFDKADENYDNILTSMYNSKEISLDVLNELQRSE